MIVILGVRRVGSCIWQEQPVAKCIDISSQNIVNLKKKEKSGDLNIKFLRPRLEQCFGFVC